MTLKNGLFFLSWFGSVAVFSGCYAHSSHYSAAYGYYEPAYVEEVYVVKPVAHYRGYGHHRYGRHCY
ncbi:MAG: hypothetical protein AAF649_00800 [Verrucomicrobiota bacterium]